MKARARPAIRDSSAAPLRRSLVACVSLLALTLAVTPAAAQAAASDPQLSCEPVPSSVPRARLALMARGFNLTGWLDGTETRRPDAAVLAELRRRGFTHIRLPVNAERLVEALSTPKSIARDTLELDDAIDKLIALGFGVSLDLHPGAKLGRIHVADPDRAFEIFDSLWRWLAKRYAGRDAERLYFEVLNEPGVTAAIWNTQGPRLAEAIRQAAPNHTIVYGPANFQRIDALTELAPLAQDNVVYAVHFYDPMVFTHQGLDWSDDPLRDLRNVPFPARLTDATVARQLRELTANGRTAAAGQLRSQLKEPWTAERIDGLFAHAAAWAARHRRPVIVNEFGVLGWKADIADRVRWLEAVRGAAERHCMGWTHWDYADGFGLARRGNGREVLDEPIVRALIGSKRDTR